MTTTAARTAGTPAWQYARRLLDWHLNVGVSLTDRRFPGDVAWRQRYREALARFVAADLEDAGVQRDLATEQISGSFEWAYREPVVEFASVANLGELARKLLELAVPEDAHRRTVPIEGEELMEAAARFYGMDRSDRTGISDGLSFLVSTSLERAPSEAKHLLLLSADLLGVAPFPEGRPDDLIERVLSGDLEIESVTGETVAEAP